MNNFVVGLNLKKNIDFPNLNYSKIRFYNNKINSRNFLDMFLTKNFLKYLNNIFLNNIYYYLEFEVENQYENCLKVNIVDLELLFEIMYFINLNSNCFFFKNIWKNIPSYSRFILILFFQNKFDFLYNKYLINVNYIFEYFNYKIDYSFLNVKNFFFFKKKKKFVRISVNNIIIFGIKIYLKRKVIYFINNKKNLYCKFSKVYKKRYNHYYLNNNYISISNILSKNNIKIINFITLLDYFNLQNFEINNLQFILFKKNKLIFNLTILQNNAFITLFDYATSYVYFVKSTAQLGFTGHSCSSKYAISMLLKLGFFKISSLNFKNLIKFKLVLSPFLNIVYYTTNYLKEILHYLKISSKLLNDNDIDDNFENDFDDGINDDINDGINDDITDDIDTDVDEDSVKSYIEEFLLLLKIGRRLGRRLRRKYKNKTKYFTKQLTINSNINYNISFNCYDYECFSKKKVNLHILKKFKKNKNLNSIVKYINKNCLPIFYISTLPIFNGCRSRKIRKKKIRHSSYSPLTGLYYHKLNKNNLIK